MIQDGQNGLIADFFDADALAAKAVAALKDPASHRPLGRAAEEMIKNRYSLDAVLPRMLDLYQRTAAIQLKGWTPTYAPTPDAPPPRTVQPTSNIRPAPKKSPFAG
jgi:hypothetical protein